jgi:hypothetical protein
MLARLFGCGSGRKTVLLVEAPVRRAGPAAFTPRCFAAGPEFSISQVGLKTR